MKPIQTETASSDHRFTTPELQILHQKQTSSDTYKQTLRRPAFTETFKSTRENGETTVTRRSTPPWCHTTETKRDHRRPLIAFLWRRGFLDDVLVAADTSGVRRDDDDQRHQRTARRRRKRKRMERKGTQARVVEISGRQGQLSVAAWVCFGGIRIFRGWCVRFCGY